MFYHLVNRMPWARNRSVKVASESYQKNGFSENDVLSIYESFVDPASASRLLSRHGKAGRPSSAGEAIAFVVSTPACLQGLRRLGVVDRQDRHDAIISALYRHLLRRAPDIEGLRHYRARLSSSESLAALVEDIMKSPEYRALSTRVAIKDCLKDHFNTDNYKIANSDLRDVGNPLDHFIEYGVKEGRCISLVVTAVSISKEDWIGDPLTSDLRSQARTPSV